MTESDWLTCTDPAPMLDFLRGSTTERKLRLFACVWAYDLWQQMSDDRCRDAVVVAERYADGIADKAELIAAHRSAAEAVQNIPVRLGGRHGKGMWASKRAGEVACLAVDPECDVQSAIRAVQWQRAATRYALSNYLRDLFGNPFRPVTVDPNWLTSTVVALAREAYESGDFSVLPILADALQDAGCENADILDHCRDMNVPHVRGCRVVDLALGKK